MMTIVSVLDSIRQRLAACFESNDYHWKTQADQSVFEQAKPFIYLLNCPKTERNDANFPVMSPSITVEVTEAAIQSSAAVQLSLVLHCCVVDSATIEREKTVMTENGTHRYIDADGYTDADIERRLYRDCLLLGEVVLHAMDGMNVDGRNVSELRLIPPTSDMEDFPYCQCQVSCKVAMLNAPKFANDASYENLL